MREMNLQRHLCQRSSDAEFLACTGMLLQWTARGCVAGKQGLQQDLKQMPEAVEVDDEVSNCIYFSGQYLERG